MLNFHCPALKLFGVGVAAAAAWVAAKQLAAGGRIAGSWPIHRAISNMFKGCFICHPLSFYQCTMSPILWYQNFFKTLDFFKVLGLKHSIPTRILLLFGNCSISSTAQYICSEDLSIALHPKAMDNLRVIQPQMVKFRWQNHDKFSVVSTTRCSRRSNGLGYIPSRRPSGDSFDCSK